MELFDKTLQRLLWRKKNGFRPIAKKGGAICGGELVNFFADKKHKNCGCAFVF